MALIFLLTAVISRVRRSSIKNLEKSYSNFSSKNLLRIYSESDDAGVVRSRQQSAKQPSHPIQTLLKLTLEIPDVFESLKRDSESRTRDAESWIRDSRHRKMGVSGDVFENFWGPTKMFFDVLMKIVGEASFIYPGPGKNPSLEAKLQKNKGFFCLGATFEVPEIDQKFQK